jgi:hypothetical protein
MNRSEIVNFYRSYRNQVLAEMQEYMDMPIEKVVKLGRFTYLVSEGPLEAEYSFKIKHIDYKTSKYIDANSKHSYDLMWNFVSDVPNELKNKKNFLRILASGLQVINDFVSNNEIDSISFSGASKGHENLYFGSAFTNRLKQLLGSQYDIVFDRENSTIMVINKEVSKLKSEAIKKRAQITNLEESTQYWKYPHLHPETPVNVKIKNEIKKRVIKSLYFKDRL